MEPQQLSRKPEAAQSSEAAQVDEPDLTGIDVYTLEGHQIKVLATRLHAIRHVNFVISAHVSQTAMLAVDGAMGDPLLRSYLLKTTAALACTSLSTAFSGESMKVCCFLTFLVLAAGRAVEQVSSTFPGCSQKNLCCKSIVQAPAESPLFMSPAESRWLYFKFHTYVPGQDAEIQFDRHAISTSPFYRSLIMADTTHWVRRSQNNTQQRTTQFKLFTVPHGYAAHWATG